MSSSPLMTTLLLVVVVVVVVVPVSSSSMSSDVALLLEKIKPALQGPSSTNPELATWNASTPLCLWRGLRWSASSGAVPCSEPGVRSNLSLVYEPSLQLVSLRLPASALYGSLPPELGAFSSLQSLLLPVNSLSGPVPLELANSPSLSQLDLASNSLTGALPASLWNLCDRLVSLRLRANALSGPVPDPAARDSACDRLRLLDLADNRFDGPFPLFLTGFRALQELDLSANRFSGPVPPELAQLQSLQSLNLSYNNFSGELPAAVARSQFGAAAFQGNDPSLCGAPLRKCGSGSAGPSSGAIAGIVIGTMAGAVVLASVSIGWVQGRKRKIRGGLSKGEGDGDDDGCGGIEMEAGHGGDEGKLIVFQGGEHLTLEDVLNATGQVMEKTSYGTMYKAKLADGGNIALRLLREGSCADTASCLPAIRQLGRVRHENLVALRAFYQGKRGEKLLIHDYFPNRTLHDLLHGRTRLLPITRSISAVLFAECSV